MNRENRILAFIKEIKTDADFQFAPSVRLPITHSAIKSGAAKQLRTKRNSFDAVAFDQLGNATVLKADGGVVQLITNKEQRDAGIR